MKEEAQLGEEIKKLDVQKLRSLLAERTPYIKHIYRASIGRLGSFEIDNAYLLTDFYGVLDTIEYFQRLLTSDFDLTKSLMIHESWVKEYVRNVEVASIMSGDLVEALESESRSDHL